MTIIIPAFDPRGVLGLRKFASVADLPSSPIPAQLCAVDDGTTTTLYQALRSGAGVAWFIVATPVSPFTIVRVDPSDGRLLQFSNDNGATWFGSAFKSNYTINTVPASGSENQITGSAFGPALALTAAAGQPGLSATGNENPAIIAVQGGTANAPAVQLVRVSDTDYPTLLESYVDGAARPNVDQHGAIVGYPVPGSLPSPDTTWLGAIVRLPGTTGVSDVAYMCIEDATGTPVWSRLAPNLNPTPPDLSPYVRPYPNLPAPGGAAITFPFLVMAQGCPLPWELPAGYTISLASGADNNWFGNDDGGDTYINNFVGSAGHDVSGFPINRLIASKFVVDTNGKVTSALGVVDMFSPLIASQNMVVVLASNQPTTLSAPSIGLAIILLTVEPPSATTVSITYDLGSGPASASLGDIITVTSDSNPFTCDVFMTTNLSAKWTVISQSGQVPYGGSGNAPGWRYCALASDCPSGTCPQGVTGSSLATDMPPDQTNQCMSFQGAAGSAFTVTLRLDTIP